MLQSNPEFAALYSTLTTAIVNPDGTTKDDKSHIARQRGAVREVHSNQTRLSSLVRASVDSWLLLRNLTPLVSCPQNTIC